MQGKMRAMNILEKLIFKDIDIMDDRFDLVVQQIQQAKNKYIKGN